MDNSGLGMDLHAKRQAGIRWAVTLAALVVVLRFLPLTAGWFPFAVPENLAYDLAFDYRSPAPPTDIAIVAIDDASLTQLGQFPFPRAVYAQLLDQLKDAKVVAFDVLFIEPDRTGGDAAFAAAIKKHGRVVLGAYKQPVAQLQASGFGERWTVIDPGQRFTSRVQVMPETNLAGPIPSLQHSAAMVGAVDIEPDVDGVYRRFGPVRMATGFKATVPHFGTSIAAVADGRTAPINGNLWPAWLRLPVGEDGSVLINYCGPPGTVPTYSFADVLAGKCTEQLQGKIVLVGATAAGLYDMRPAPYRSAGRKFFGVETNANIVNTLLHRHPLVDGTHSLLWLAVALVLGVLAGFLVWSAGELTGPLMGVGLLVLVAVPSFFLAFFGLGVVIPYGAFLWATLLPVALGTIERMGAERRMIKQQFSAYVSADVLYELMREPEAVRWGQRRTVTVLFSDVRGSTALSESLPPEVWISELNEYLSAMSAAIFEQDGYLDKFMGDGIMAVWNTFGTQPDHAERALRCAQRMLQLLAALNQSWAGREDRKPLRIGLGLHSGEAIVGNVGSETRTQYTVIGDVVNTGSRIEGMTKEYSTPLLLSEATAEFLPDRAGLKEIGEVEVRGREGKIRIWSA